MASFVVSENLLHQIHKVHKMSFRVILNAANDFRAFHRADELPDGANCASERTRRTNYAHT